MSPTLIATLIGEVGLPFIRDLLGMMKDNKEITPEEWLKLLPKVRTYDDYIKEAQSKVS